jgi:hypothetical protein
VDKVVALKGAEAGSKLQDEFKRDQALAERYLAEVNVKDMFALYQHRCEQLNDFSSTLMTMAEMYAGKSSRNDFSSSPDAVKAMERVALAAIDLAKAISGKAK